MLPLRIVLANGSLLDYPEGGGHWIIRLQYLLGLRSLGHHPVLFEFCRSTGTQEEDERMVKVFFEILKGYGLQEDAFVLMFPKYCREQSIERARAYGKSMLAIKELIQSADLLWNDCDGLRQPLLGLFPYRVLMDLDPGHLQVCGTQFNMDIQDHHAFLTVGTKMQDPDCDVPRLGLTWRTCTPFVYLPLWRRGPDPGPDASFSSVTHWTWGELSFRGRVLSTSKRAAYLRYADLPQRTGRPFELAACIGETEPGGDCTFLENSGWKVVDPHVGVRTPAQYQSYIRASRAEISCPKPIFRELKTGWFSDRSVCYLASGRPVLAEDTGFSDHIPTGEGLLAFRDMDEAVAGVAEIDANYERHSRAARSLAEEYFDSRRCLESILQACGTSSGPAIGRASSGDM